jgi:hypothetical protein
MFPLQVIGKTIGKRDEWRRIASISVKSGGTENQGTHYT